MIWWYQSLIFPYTRLELFASYFRGHAMSKVVTALQDGVKLMELFGWSRKKKISLWLTNPGWWLSFLLHKIISIMSFFLSPLHSTETFWSHVLHFMPWKLSFPHFQTFFFLSHVIVPYCWHISPKLAICRVWSPSTFYIPNLKILYWLPIYKSPQANQCRCFLAAVNF